MTQVPRFLSQYKPLFIITFFFVVLLPVIPIFSYDNYNHQRICQIALVFLFTSFAGIKWCFTNPTNTLLLDSKFAPLFAIFVITGLVSAAISNEPSYSLFYCLHITLLIFFILPNLSIKHATLALIYALVIAHSILVLFCFLKIIFTMYEQQPLNAYVIYSGFNNIRFFNQVQVFVLPFLVFLLSYQKIQRVVFFILLLNLLLMFIGGARGALLSFIIISIATFYFTPQFRKIIFKGFLCLLLSYFAYLALEYTLSPEYAASMRTSTSGRARMWLEILTDFSFQNILFGHGPGIYDITFNPAKHPHNSVFEILNEWGATALIALSCAVYLTYKVTSRYLKSHRNDTVTLTLCYSLSCGALYSFFSGVHVMPIPQTLLIIFWGALLGRVYRPLLTQIKVNNVVKFLFLLFFTVVWSFYLYIAISVYNGIDPSEGYTSAPRFWSIGQRVL